MGVSIREHIINNFKGDDYETLRNAIEESIKEQDEITLPGMGVFFEIVWKEADTALKNKILELIKQRVERGTDNDN